MKVYIASDHAGFELKEALVSYLAERAIESEDLGAYTFDSGDDYNDYMVPLALRVAQEKDSFGIGIGGSGQGEGMAINRIPGVRATVFYGGNFDVVQVSREHNDANILSLGARFMTADEAKHAVEIFLATKFSNDERHVRRLQKLA